jgi:hypothetical protein
MNQVKETKVKPDIVEIVRYYRPLEESIIGPVKASNRGVTVMFTLDYPKRQFTARWAVCNGDNFSKVTGIQYAQACAMPIVGKLLQDKDLYVMLVVGIAEVYDEAKMSAKEKRNLNKLYIELVGCV